MIKLTAALAAVILLTACADPEPIAREPAQFTVRARWPDAALPLIHYRLEAETAPIDPAIAQRAIGRAADVWNQTGLVRFHPAPDAGNAATTLLIGWRRGHHGACMPFGPGADVAHAGPVAPGTFIHLDLARTWDEPSVFGTVLHELGHVIGLGHSEAPSAVMGIDPLRPTTLAADDLAGLRSLYDRSGEADYARGDVTIGNATVLRRVAPAATTDYAAFDSDGDGDDELLVWRTDPAGHGSLMIYHFAAGPALSQTFGPFPGAVAADARIGFATDTGDARYLVCRFKNGNEVVRQFDRYGIPAMPTSPPRREVLDRADRRLTGDFDGDGQPDRLLGPAIR